MRSMSNSTTWTEREKSTWDNSIHFRKTNGNKCLLLYFEEEKGSTVEVYVRVCVNEMDTSVQLGRESSFTYYYLFVSVCVCRSLLTHAGTHKKGIVGPLAVSRLCQVYSTDNFTARFCSCCSHGPAQSVNIAQQQLFMCIFLLEEQSRGNNRIENTPN